MAKAVCNMMSFNPCCNGNDVEHLSIEVKGKTLTSFNPCCNGNDVEHKKVLVRSYDAGVF